MLSRSCDQIKRTFFCIIGLCAITVPLIKLQTFRKVLSAAIVTRSKLYDMHYPSQWDIGMRDAKESFNERTVQNENIAAMPICSYWQVVFLNVVVIGSNLLETGIVSVDTNSLIDRPSTVYTHTLTLMHVFHNSCFCFHSIYHHFAIQRIRANCSALSLSVRTLVANFSLFDYHT